MSTTNQPTNGYQTFIEQSVAILEEHLEDISNINDWAKLMGYSRSYFSTLFADHFGECPSQCLYRIRYQRLHKIILKHPNETSYSISQRLGLQDDQALYKFLNRHYDTNFTEVRNKLLNGNR